MIAFHLHFDVNRGQLQLLRGFPFPDQGFSGLGFGVLLCVLLLLVILSTLLVEEGPPLVMKAHVVGQLRDGGQGRVGTDQDLLLAVVLVKAEVGADEVVVLNTGRQLHGEAVKRDNLHFIHDQHHLRPCDVLLLRMQGGLPGMGGAACLLDLVVVLFDANQHVHRIVDVHAGRVAALKVLFAHGAEEAADGVEAVRGEVLVRGLGLGRGNWLESGEVGVEGPAHIWCGLNGALSR